LASSWLWLGYLMAGLHNRDVGYSLGITWWGYALTECRAVVQYLCLTVWPHPLILDYGQYAPTGPLAAVAPYALILVVLATGVLFALKRQPAIGFVGAWFFVILAPTSSVVPIGGSPMAEHRMYLPLAAVVTMAVVGAVALGKRLFDRQQGVMLGCVAGGSVTVLLTFLSIQRNQDYNSPVTIWQGTVEKYPNNSRAHYNLGAALLQNGELQDAIGHLEQAVRIQPDFADAHNSAGVALEQAGRVQEAIGHYERALQIRPDFADAHNNLGIALMRQGSLAEAIGQYEQALRIQPDYVRAQCNWANALLRMGQVPEAIQHYEQALRIQPDFAEVHYNVGLALEKVGRTPEAIQHYEQALRIRPDFVQAQYALARLRGAE
jgi:Tfp pilus assembly protein PilF